VTVEQAARETAGLQVNDVIVKFNGQDIADSQTLIDAINKAKVGQSADIIYWRGSSQQTMTVVLAETPNLKTNFRD